MTPGADVARAGTCANRSPAAYLPTQSLASRPPTKDDREKREERERGIARCLAARDATGATTVCLCCAGLWRRAPSFTGSSGSTTGQTASGFDGTSIPCATADRQTTRSDRSACRHAAAGFHAASGRDHAPICYHTTGTTYSRPTARRSRAAGSWRPTD